MRWPAVFLVWMSSCRSTEDSMIYSDPNEAFVSRENHLRGAHLVAEVDIGGVLPAVERPHPDGTIVDYQWSVNLRAALWRPDGIPREITVLTSRPTDAGQFDDRPNRARFTPGRRLLVGALRSSAFSNAMVPLGAWRVDPATRTLLEAALGFPVGTSVDTVLDASTLRGLYGPDSGINWNGARDASSP